MQSGMNNFSGSGMNNFSGSVPYSSPQPQTPQPQLHQAMYSEGPNFSGSVSFGVVALEIVSGMNNVKFKRDENFVCLLDWILYLQKNGDKMEMVDPRLGSAFNKKEVVRMINVALLCTNQSPALRPTMSIEVSMLEGKTYVEELVMVPRRLSDKSGNATALCNKFAQASFSGSSSENKSLAKSCEGPWTAFSSSSAQVLYPVHIK
ncbi:hypothetical protein DKX38_028967 [Salix brachista]|uniref:Serine-threonine/tyrosine-protein kinase catalytic domain-containing protein n=1 Tax=Salix brachista TaxID=2182728 RepID=A0A5N5IXX9_9ROSI|nr:hypothetical protein DKX38_028967 [Salix brachista]